MAYVPYNANPKNRRTEDCVVRALSMVLGIPWDTMYWCLSARGFVDKAVLTDDDLWGRYLTDHGFTMQALPRTCPHCYTVKQFSMEHPYGAYVIKTPGHVLACVDGDYYDTTDTGDEAAIYCYAKV